MTSKGLSENFYGKLGLHVSDGSYIDMWFSRIFLKKKERLLGDVKPRVVHGISVS